MCSHYIFALLSPSLILSLFSLVSTQAWRVKLKTFSPENLAHGFRIMCILNHCIIHIILEKDCVK